MTSEAQRRMLVVDDEADVREYLPSALEDAGFACRPPRTVSGRWQV